MAIVAAATPVAAIDLTVNACELVDYSVPVGSSVTFALPPGCTVWGGFTIVSGDPTTFDTTVTFTAGGQVVNFGADLGGSIVQRVATCDVPPLEYAPDDPWRVADYCNLSSGPPAVLQQFGAPAGRDCTEVAPASLNIGGVGPGGWGRSWAQWVHDGRGGAVCSRMLTFSSSAGHYVVAS